MTEEYKTVKKWWSGTDQVWV